jgi:hypothetical protein
LLNSRLAEKADNLELAEEQLWNIFAAYQGLVNEVDIDYPGSFNIRDDQREFQQLASARSASTNPKVWNIIDGKIVELLGEEYELYLNDDLSNIDEIIKKAKNILTDNKLYDDYIKQYAHVRERLSPINVANNYKNIFNI